MKNNLEQKFDEFLTDEELENSKLSKNYKTIENDRTIIERIDRIVLTEDGRQLLREQY